MGFMYAWLACARGLGFGRHKRSQRIFLAQLVRFFMFSSESWANMPNSVKGKGWESPAAVVSGRLGTSVGVGLRVFIAGAGVPSSIAFFLLRLSLRFSRRWRAWRAWRVGAKTMSCVFPAKQLFLRGTTESIIIDHQTSKILEARAAHSNAFELIAHALMHYSLLQNTEHTRPCHQQCHRGLRPASRRPRVTAPNRRRRRQDQDQDSPRRPTGTD